MPPSSPPLSPPSHRHHPTIKTAGKPSLPDVSAFSLWSILRLHQRERLVAAPIHWTARHLDLLSCHFICERRPPVPPRNQQQLLGQVSPPLSPSHDEPGGLVESRSDDQAKANSTASPPNDTRDRNSSPKTTSPTSNSLPPSERHVATLARCGVTSFKESALRNILAICLQTVEQTSKRLYFRFESHRIRMPCSVFSCPPSSSLPTDGPRVPTIAYLDRGQLRCHREASLQYIYLPRSSKATARLYHRRLGHITPSDPVRDPYIVALLIALAQSQRHRYHESLEARPAPESFKVHALVGDSEDRHHLVVYTAHVPAAALDRFADPHTTPPASARLAIQTTSLPFQPFASFPERLARTIYPRGTKRSREADDTEPPKGTKAARH
ncbi:transposase [Colletotrichum tofieldiae]|uniref:Transposase n=1 Tax=Colletotrichum tofieldiae TaxID=708197 RepID=A0A166P276_9PEZI|nr:transposase [Colletotrichum tofieldiae]